MVGGSGPVAGGGGDGGGCGKFLTHSHAPGQNQICFMPPNGLHNEGT